VSCNFCGGRAGASVPGVFSKFPLKLDGNHGREIFPQARGTYSLDVAEQKVSEREPALSPCWLGKLLGLNIFQTDFGTVYCTMWTVQVEYVEGSWYWQVICLESEYWWCHVLTYWRRYCSKQDFCNTPLAVVRQWNHNAEISGCRAAVIICVQA
jgi:hypothetical protein